MTGRGSAHFRRSRPRDARLASRYVVSGDRACSVVATTIPSSRSDRSQPSLAKTSSARESLTFRPLRERLALRAWHQAGVPEVDLGLGLLARPDLVPDDDGAPRPLVLWLANTPSMENPLAFRPSLPKPLLLPLRSLVPPFVAGPTRIGSVT